MRLAVALGHDAQAPCVDDVQAVARLALAEEPLLGGKAARLRGREQLLLYAGGERAQSGDARAGSRVTSHDSFRAAARVHVFGPGGDGESRRRTHQPREGGR